jgi:hypothetical protein
MWSNQNPAICCNCRRWRTFRRIRSEHLQSEHLYLDDNLGTFWPLGCCWRMGLILATTIALTFVGAYLDVWATLPPRKRR